jgi:phage terminase small subunit
MPRKVPRQPPRLRPQQVRFVQEYLVDVNGTQAAIRAGYSPRTAQEQASRLLSNVMVAAAIAQAQAARSERTQVSQDAVLQELAALAFSDVTHYHIDDVGQVVLAAAAPRHAMRAVASLRRRVIHRGEDLIYDTEVRLWNKPETLKMVGQHLGMFQEPEHALPDIHVHVHTARDRVLTHLATMAQRQHETSDDAPALPDGPSGGPAERGA